MTKVGRETEGSKREGPREGDGGRRGQSRKGEGPRKELGVGRKGERHTYIIKTAGQDLRHLSNLTLLT